MTQGNVNVCHNRWLILIFDMSKTRRSVLRHSRGEEHLLLRQYFHAATASILRFAITLFPYSPRYHVAGCPQLIRSYL